MKGRRVSFSCCLVMLICNISLGEKITELTRARRQTVKSLPRLRHPRQLIFPFSQFGSQNSGSFRPHGRRNFVHFGNTQPPVAFQELPKSLGPSAAPQTSPVSIVSPDLIISETKSKLLGPVKVEQNSDDFHHHSFEDGRGNFQFFQLGKRKDDEVRLGSQNLRPTPNFFPTPLPQHQNEIPVEQTKIDSTDQHQPKTNEDFIFQPTVSPSLATLTTAFKPTETTQQISSRRIEFTQDPREPRTSFTPSSQPFFAGTAIPVRQLPRMPNSNPAQSFQQQFQRFQPNQPFQPTQSPFAGFQPTPTDVFPNPEQPAGLPFQANSNNFAPIDQPVLAPFPSNPTLPANTAILTGSNSLSNLGLQLFKPSSNLGEPRSPTNPSQQIALGPFQRQKSQPLDKPQPSNTNVFLGTPRPQDVRQLPQFPQMNLNPAFRALPPIPQQFMPISQKPKFAKTRHLPEPRIISKKGGNTPVFKQPSQQKTTSKAEIPNTPLRESARSQPQPFIHQPRTSLISFNALRDLQTSKRPMFQNIQTTKRPTTTTMRTTTKPTTKSTTTRRTTLSTTTTTTRSTTRRTTRTTTKTPTTTSRFGLPNFQRFSATMTPKPPKPKPQNPTHFTVFTTKPPMKNMEMRLMQPPKQTNSFQQQERPIQSQNQDHQDFHSNLIVNHKNVVGPNFQTTTVFAPNSNMQQDANTARVNPVQQNFRQNSFNPINQAIQANTQSDIIPMQTFQLNTNTQHNMNKNTNSIQPAFGTNIQPLHVFHPAPVDSNFQPQQIRGPNQNVGLAQNTRMNLNSGPSQNAGPTHDILSNLSPEQLQALRQQLHANRFPQPSFAKNQQSFGTNFDQNQIDTNQLQNSPPSFPTRQKPQPTERFRSNQNRRPNSANSRNTQFRRPAFSEPTTTEPTTSTSTTTTTTTTTTTRPINFHLKSRERLRHRNRKRGRNPKFSRTTSRPTSRSKSEQPSFIRPSSNTNVNRRTEPSEKPNMFDPFNRVSRLEPIKKEFNLDTSLETAQNFAQNQVRDQSFSQSKMSAFANLLAIANDSPIEASESTTITVPSTTSTNIALISLGEGGLMPHKTKDKTDKNSKVNQFEFFTPRSMEKKTTSSRFGLSTTMGTPIVPAFDDDYPNFVLISSTSSPRTFSTSPPRLTFEDSSVTTVSPKDQTAVSSNFQFAPTPMTESKDDLHVFSFQPTPMTKRFKFRPSPKSRTFKLPKEAFTDNSISNEIENFSPKFVVDPDMKENFAIVKVKNHNLSENEKTATPSATPAKEDKSKPSEDTPINLSTTTSPPRDRVRSLLSKNPLRKRGRFIKKIKSSKSPKSALTSKSDPSKSKTRRRLQFIRRVTLMPRLLNQKRGRGGAPKAPMKEDNSVLTEAANAIDAGNSLLQINSEARKNEVEADAKVAELANNILELKAKLEQLKMELQV